jgi:hypothetical protein
MTTPDHPSRRIFLTLVVGASLAVIPAFAQDKVIAPEKNPPGDIPDSQVFVTYSSPLGFALKVPEGWSRTDSASGVAFADKYGRIDVSVADAAAGPTAATAKTGAAAELEKTGRAVKITSVKDVTLPAGRAVQIMFAANSEPNSVTGKQIRLESERTLIFHAGKLAAITFSAPAGADNADQWKLMADSFRWR